MNFNKLAKKIYFEARGADEPELELPENPFVNVGGKFNIESGGARNYEFLPKNSPPEELAAAKGKTRTNVEGEIEKRKSQVYSAAAAAAFRKLKSKNFTPEDEYERESVQEFMSYGMDEKVSDVLYLMGKIFRNLASLSDVILTAKEKKIKILVDPDRDVLDMTTIPLMADETLKIFMSLVDDLIEENNFKSLLKSGNKLIPALKRGVETPIQKRVRLGWKRLIDGLRQLSKKQQKDILNWKLKIRQTEASINVLALHVSSTPTNWVIYTIQRSKDPEAYLPQVYKDLESKQDRMRNRWPMYKGNEGRNLLPIRFINGVPQYGQQLQGKRGEDGMAMITNEQMLDRIGFETIWNVIYAWNRGEKTYQIPNTNKVINLQTLKISRYKLSPGQKIARAREEKMAKTKGERPEYRVKELSPQEKEEIKQAASQLEKESLENVYGKLLVESTK